MNKHHRSIRCPGVGATGCIMSLIDYGSIPEHEFWRHSLDWGWIPKPILPAELVRITDSLGEESGIFEEGGQRNPAAAADRASSIGPASSEASIEHRTAVAFSEATKALALKATVAPYYAKDVQKKPQLISPSQHS